MKSKSIKIKARRKLQRYVDFTNILYSFDNYYPIRILNNYYYSKDSK